MGQPTDRPGLGSSSRAATLRIKRGAKTLSEVPLGKARLVVGGGATAQLRLKNAGLPDECLVIDLRSVPFTVETRLGPDQVFVNAWALSGKKEIKPGDRIEFNGIVLEMLDVDGKVPARAAGAPAPAPEAAPRRADGPTDRDRADAASDRLRRDGPSDTRRDRPSDTRRDGPSDTRRDGPSETRRDGPSDRSLEYMGKKTAAKVLMEEIERARARIEQNRPGVAPGAAPSAGKTVNDDPRAQAKAQAPPPAARAPAPPVPASPVPVRTAAPAPIPAQPTSQVSSVRRPVPVGAVSEISVAVAAAEPQTGFSRPPWLEAIGGEGASDARLYLLRNGVIAGRQGELRVQHASVSKKHARFDVRGGTLWVEDLGSTNGTWVNRERVQQPRPIGDGDTLHLGAVEFRVRIPEAAKREIDALGSPQRPAEAEPFGPELSTQFTAPFRAKKGPSDAPPERSVQQENLLFRATEQDVSGAVRSSSAAPLDAPLMRGTVSEEIEVRVPQAKQRRADGATLREGDAVAAAPTRTTRKDSTLLDMPAARGGRAPAGMDLDPDLGLGADAGMELGDEFLDLRTPEPVPGRRGPARSPAPPDRGPSPFDSPTLDRPGRRDRTDNVRAATGQVAIPLPRQLEDRPRRSPAGLFFAAVGFMLLVAVSAGGWVARDELRSLVGGSGGRQIATNDCGNKTIKKGLPEVTPVAEPTPDRRVASLDKGGGRRTEPTPFAATPIPTPTPAGRLGKDLFGDEKIDIHGDGKSMDLAGLEQGSSNNRLRSERAIGVAELKTIYVDEGTAIVRTSLGDDGFTLAPSAADAADASERELGAKQIDTKKVNGLIRARFDDVKRCLVGSSGFKGGKARVVVQFTLNPNGSVTELRLIESDVKGKKFDGCVTGVVRTIKFPRPKEQSVIVQFPFVFFYN